MLNASIKRIRMEGVYKIIWLMLTVMVKTSMAQIPINNQQCPAGIGQRIRDISDEYVSTYWEYQHLLEEREEIKKKYEKEIQEIKDKYNPTIEKLTRQNSRMSSMIDMSKDLAIDCKWYHEKDPSLKSGVYELSVGGLVFPAYCDMDTEGGGWTVLARRDAFSSFEMNRTWQEYKEGFGDVKKNYWLGNEINHKLTKGRPSIVIIYVMRKRRRCVGLVSKYDKLQVSSEKDRYRLFFHGATRYRSRSIILVNNTNFSTYDNDGSKDGYNCAARKGYGWWFNSSSCLPNPFIWRERLLWRRVTCSVRLMIRYQ